MAKIVRDLKEAVAEIEELRTGSSAPSSDHRSLEKALGAQIRLLRRRQDLSVSDLATAAGISLGMMSKIENGQISPSLTTVQSLAVALSVPISSLFASVEDRQDCSFVPAGRGVHIERRGTKSGHDYQLLGHLLRGDVVVEPYLITLHENAVPYTSFSHEGVELIYMLEGELTYRHGGESYHLRPGDTMLFDSGAQHGPEQLLVHPMRYLSIIIYPRASS
ncbi:XRE family transcriptional regulator [Sphingomonas oleivorans]|uniref:XRE family transcriptional regulator n=1 Tax=Sphingomonas oleivorans TaxID=1735121 RepID=A0A2T5G2Z6_9SPHN|nr:helix-turn-helix domain-containing protein [Sphingomonas oleivorans]PTQ13519.1 XRE family transcriptional regulator [Sphingomonas oleivorans]